jgi:hypothetical protein
LGFFLIEQLVFQSYVLELFHQAMQPSNSIKQLTSRLQTKWSAGMNFFTLHMASAASESVGFQFKNHDYVLNPSISTQQ